MNSSGYLEIILENASIAVTGTFWQTTQPVSCTTANCSVNLGQVGGASFSLGQQAASASLPVIGTGWTPSIQKALTTTVQSVKASASFEP